MQSDQQEIRPSTRALDDARSAISLLGPRARRAIPPAATVQFGEWLGWPDWLKYETSLPEGAGLPDRISVADDLLCVANIIDHGFDIQILRRLFEEPKISGAPVVGPALYNAPTVLDALQLFVRSLAIGTPFIKTELVVDKTKFSIGISADFEPGPILGFVAMASFLMAQRFIGTFVPDAQAQSRISLCGERTESLAKFLSNVPGTFLHSSQCYALHGDAKWLAARNLQTDPAFWAFALERMSLFEREGSQSDIVERIRSAICITIQTENRVPRLKQIASKEGLSERTLVRNLAAQGTSFHKIVEEERRLKATELIGNGAISLAEIAAALGFTDMSSFGRSFRKWFGVTPGQARNWRSK